MHHGQSRGKRKHVKYVKTRKFNEIRGIWKRMGKEKFPEIGVKCIETAKIEREISNLLSMTKNGRQKFWRMKIGIFF